MVLVSAGVVCPSCIEAMVPEEPGTGSRVCQPCLRDLI